MTDPTLNTGGRLHCSRGDCQRAIRNARDMTVDFPGDPEAHMDALDNLNRIGEYCHQAAGVAPPSSKETWMRLSRWAYTCASLHWARVCRGYAAWMREEVT